jgi:hypothetical protein
VIDDDVFGQAAVAVDGDDLLLGAELLDALCAEGACEARLLIALVSLTRDEVTGVSTQSDA